MNSPVFAPSSSLLRLYKKSIETGVFVTALVETRDFSQIFLCLEPNLDQKYLQTVLQNVMGVVQLIEYSCHRRNTFKLDCLPAQFSLKHSGDNTHAYTFLCINEPLSQSIITLKIRTKSLNSTPFRRTSPEVNWIRV